MIKKITVSDLRTQLRQIFEDVTAGQSEYVIEESGEPTAAIISMEDFQLLQSLKKKSEVESNTFLSQLQAIHQHLEAGGHRFRTKEEVDAQIREERDSWD